MGWMIRRLQFSLTSLRCRDVGDGHIVTRNRGKVNLDRAGGVTALLPFFAVLAAGGPEVIESAPRGFTPDTLLALDSSGARPHPAAVQESAVHPVSQGGAVLPPAGAGVSHPGISCLDERRAGNYSRCW
jgi:hypothetical protein